MKEKVTSRYDFVYFSSKISSKDKKISFLFFFFMENVISVMRKVAVKS